MEMLPNVRLEAARFATKYHPKLALSRVLDLFLTKIN